jgi:tetratricopeptide (TPR) repeat protein
MKNYCAWMLTLLPLLIMPAHAPAAQEQFSGSKTIVGRTNSLLVEGAAALNSGRVEEGIRLTLEGLKEAATVQDNAVGHSNACAGYVLLRQWAEALTHCNAALALDTSNWRTYNNRAAIYIEQGLFELGLQDLKSGLALAPEAPLLHESMRILERNRRISGRQERKALAS